MKVGSAREVPSADISTGRAARRWAGAASPRGARLLSARLSSAPTTCPFPFLLFAPSQPRPARAPPARSGRGLFQTRPGPARPPTTPPRGPSRRRRRPDAATRRSGRSWKAEAPSPRRSPARARRSRCASAGRSRSRCRGRLGPGGCSARAWQQEAQDDKETSQPRIAPAQDAGSRPCPAFVIIVPRHWRGRARPRPFLCSRRPSLGASNGTTQTRRQGPLPKAVLGVPSAPHFVLLVGEFRGDIVRLGRAARESGSCGQWPWDLHTGGATVSGMACATNLILLVREFLRKAAWGSAARVKWVRRATH